MGGKEERDVRPAFKTFCAQILTCTNTDTPAHTHTLVHTHLHIPTKLKEENIQYAERLLIVFEHSLKSISL